MSDLKEVTGDLIPREQADVLSEQTTGNAVFSFSGEMQNAQDNPAIAYLVSLGSKRSRQTMGSFLNIVAKILGYQSLRDCVWCLMRRHHIQTVLEILGDAEKAPATINTYLSALKGVALEAWMMKQIDTDSFQHIKQIRSMKGFRLPKGRALEKHEIKQIFFTCESDPSAKGVRDAAIFGVLLGCGLRRSEIVALDMKSVIYRESALKILGKGNKERMSYVPNGAWRRLDEWVEKVRGTHEAQWPLSIRMLNQR